MTQLSLQHVSVLAFNAPLHVRPPTSDSCLTEYAQAASVETYQLVKIEWSSVMSLPASPLKDNLLGLHSEQFCLDILHQPQAVLNIMNMEETISVGHHDPLNSCMNSSLT